MSFLATQPLSSKLLIFWSGRAGRDIQFLCLATYLVLLLLPPLLLLVLFGCQPLLPPLLLPLLPPLLLQGVPCGVLCGGADRGAGAGWGLGRYCFNTRLGIRQAQPWRPSLGSRLPQSDVDMQTFIDRVFVSTSLTIASGTVART